MRRSAAQMVDATIGFRAEHPMIETVELGLHDLLGLLDVGFIKLPETGVVGNGEGEGVPVARGSTCMPRPSGGSAASRGASAGEALPWHASGRALAAAARADTTALRPKPVDGGGGRGAGLTIVPSRASRQSWRDRQDSFLLSCDFAFSNS